MLLTIITPVYNGSRFLERCVESIVSQSFEDWEMIIVDDGSTDATPGICDSLAEKDSRIRVIHKQNEGVSIARNTALAEAKGEYVMFVDSDDELMPGALQLMAHAAGEFDKPDILRGEYVAIDPESNVLFKSRNARERRKEFRKYAAEDFARKCIKTDFFIWLMWIRREVIGETRFTKERVYMEDAELIVGLLPKLGKCAYTRQPIYRYRKYPEAVSSSLNIRKVGDIVDITREWCGNLGLEKYKAFRKYQNVVINNCVDMTLRYFAELNSCLRTKEIESSKFNELVDLYMVSSLDKKIGIDDLFTDDMDKFLKTYLNRRKVFDTICKINNKIKDIIR